MWVVYYLIWKTITLDVVKLIAGSKYKWNCAKKKPNLTQVSWLGFILFGAVDGTWTRTLSDTPLKRARMPIPPQLHNFKRTDILYNKT